MRKHQAKQERAKNYKVDFGQRGEERQRNKQDKLWGFGRKNPHTRKHSPPQFPENAVFASGNAVSPSAFPRQQLYTASHCSGASRVTAVTWTRCHAPTALAGPGANIPTDRLLWTVKPRVVTDSSCKACFCDLSLPSVCMGRMECHRAYPLRYSWLKQLCKANLKTCLSHVFRGLHLFKLSSWSIKLLTSSF